MKENDMAKRKEKAATLAGPDIVVQTCRKCGGKLEAIRTTALPGYICRGLDGGLRRRVGNRRCRCTECGQGWVLPVWEAVPERNGQNLANSVPAEVDSPADGQ